MSTIVFEDDTSNMTYYFQCYLVKIQCIMYIVLIYASKARQFHLHFKWLTTRYKCYLKFKNSISISIFMFSSMIKDFANWLNKLRFKRCFHSRTRKFWFAFIVLTQKRVKIWIRKNKKINLVIFHRNKV